MVVDEVGTITLERARQRCLYVIGIDFAMASPHDRRSDVRCKHIPHSVRQNRDERLAFLERIAPLEFDEASR